jgi:hypothetical protein
MWFLKVHVPSAVGTQHGSSHSGPNSSRAPLDICSGGASWTGDRNPKLTRHREGEGHVQIANQTVGRIASRDAPGVGWNSPRC